MKKLILPLIALLAISSCDEGGDELASKPPFDEFVFSTNFELPTLNTTTFANLNIYNAYGLMLGNQVTSGDYAYSVISSASTVPAGCILSVASTPSVITVQAEGQLPRVGSTVPEEYNGDKNQWSNSCYFKIIIEANPGAKTIKSATLQLTSDKFKASYDISDLTEFLDFSNQTNTSLPEWSISTSAGSKVGSLQRLSVSFRINDVHGTNFKK